MVVNPRKLALRRDKQSRVPFLCCRSKKSYRVKAEPAYCRDTRSKAPRLALARNVVRCQRPGRSNLSITHRVIASFDDDGRLFRLTLAPERHRATITLNRNCNTASPLTHGSCRSRRRTEPRVVQRPAFAGGSPRKSPGIASRPLDHISRKCSPKPACSSHSGKNLSFLFRIEKVL